MKRALSILAAGCLVGVSVGLGATSDRAIAQTPAQSSKCLLKVRFPAPGALTGQTAGSPVNLRERSNTRSKIKAVSSVGAEVSVRRRVTGEGGYCWYQVQVKKSKAEGWVRGDFVDIHFD